MPLRLNAPKPLLAQVALPPRQLHASDLRPLVLSWARRMGAVLSEVGLQQHRSRIDYLVVTPDDRLVGIEVKSDRDRLAARWRRQRRCWEPVFDDLWLVTTHEVWSRATARRQVPDFWGVALASIDPGPVEDLVLIRERSPSRIDRPDSSPDPDALWPLLWKSELEVLGRRLPRGERPNLRLPTTMLASELQCRVPASEARELLVQRWRQAEKGKR